MVYQDPGVGAMERGLEGNEFPIQAFLREKGVVEKRGEGMLKLWRGGRKGNINMGLRGMDVKSKRAR